MTLVIFTFDANQYKKIYKNSEKSRKNSKIILILIRDYVSYKTVYSLNKKPYADELMTDWKAKIKCAA